MNSIKIKDGFKDQKITVCPISVINSLEQDIFIKNICLTDIGYFPNAKYHFVEREKGCSENILIFCKNGMGAIDILGKTYIIKKDMVILIPKDTPHTYFSSNENPWTIMWLHFNGSHAEYYINKFENSFLVELKLENSIKLESLFNEILNLLEKGVNEKSLLFSSQCLNYILSIITFHNDSFIEKIKISRDYLNSAVEFMIKNLEKNLALDDIANAIYLSKSHLSLIFKQETGCSPVEFFIKLKIQHSCSMLKYTDWNIKRIATRFGYEDQYYFSRVFKKIMDVSPSEYRKENSK